MRKDVKKGVWVKRVIVKGKGRGKGGVVNE